MEGGGREGGGEGGVFHFVHGGGVGWVIIHVTVCKPLMFLVQVQYHESSSYILLI